MPNVELRSKTELTSIAGTENIYVQEAGSPYTVKRALLSTLRTWISEYITSLGVTTAYKQTSYAILDDDGYQRIEVDTTSAACTITLPLMANNRGRRIEIAFVKNDASADVVTVSPHATDANKLSNDLLGSIILPKVGNFLVVQESVNSGCWEVIDERITSQIRLNTHAGYGSSATKIPYFTNTVENVGNMMTLANGSTDGCLVTINRSGKYSFNFGISSTLNSPMAYGLSLNSASLTTAYASITITEQLGHVYIGTNSATTFTTPLTITVYLKKGDVVRPHTTALTPADVARSFFTASYIG